MHYTVEITSPNTLAKCAEWSESIFNGVSEQYGSKLASELNCRTMATVMFSGDAREIEQLRDHIENLGATHFPGMRSASISYSGELDARQGRYMVRVPFISLPGNAPLLATLVDQIHHVNPTAIPDFSAFLKRSESINKLDVLEETQRISIENTAPFADISQRHADEVDRAYQIHQTREMAGIKVDDPLRPTREDVLAINDAHRVLHGRINAVHNPGVTDDGVERFFRSSGQVPGVD